MARNRITFVLLLLALLSSVLPALAQRGEGPIDPAPPKDKTPDQIIQTVAAKELEFQAARDRYVYRQSVKVEELDSDGGSVAGMYQQISDITFDDQGRRSENVVYAPQSTLKNIMMTKEDIDDIEHHFPFVITTDTLPIYDVKYVGHQQVDELGTYVFDLTPVHMQKGKRYFQGRIWVDDRDLMIVKTSGIGVPNDPTENQPVPFTTWREQIDGKYWFPTYTSGQTDIRAVDKHGRELAPPTPVRVVVKYTDYKQYKSTVKITYGDEVVPPPQPQSTAPQQQQQPNNNAPQGSTPK